MRISDWSSDVCSSDLQLCAVTTAVALGAGVMRLSSLAAGGLPRLEEPCSRAAELPFAVLWLFSKFRTFGPVVRDDADNRGRLQNLLLSVLEQLPKSFQDRKSTRLNSSH